MNPTAAWAWRNQHGANLIAHYSAAFNIPKVLAERDITSLQESWDRFYQAAIPPPAPPSKFASPISTTNFALQNKIFQLRFATPDLADELNNRLQILPHPEAEPDHIFDLVKNPDSTYSVFCDGRWLGTEAYVTGARVHALLEITRLAVPNRECKLILHAGAMGDNRSCVILAGASFSGKSTLCAALMQSGLLCYSDDSVILTHDFEVTGMPFAISLRESSWHLFPELYQPRFIPSNLNGTSPNAKPTALVFVNYQPDAQTQLEPVETFEALVEINKSGFWVEHTESSIAAYIDWLSRLPIFRLTYSNLNEGKQAIYNLLPSAPMLT